MLITPALSAAYQHLVKYENTPVPILSMQDVSHSDHESTLMYDHCSHFAAHFVALPSAKEREFTDNSKWLAFYPGDLMGYLLLDLPYSPPKS